MTNTDKAPLDVIAASLRRERHRAGLSLTEVARRAGIAKSTLSQLESGTGNPSLETLWAICVALDAPFSRLLDPPRPHIVVISAGRALVGVAAEPVELGPGDYISYPADVPHVFEALEPRTQAVLLSE